MSNHSKFKKLAIPILIGIVALCGCGKKEESIHDYNTVIVAEIYDESYGECALHKDSEANYIYEVREDKIVNKITNYNSYDTSELMVLNESIDKNNITLKDRYTNDTYEASLDESSAHVKYLQSAGYKITRQVNTKDFIDMLLSKGKDVKRVVIYNDKIIVCSIEPKELNIENYIK